MDKCILPEAAAGELELLEMQEDQGLQIFYKSSKSINEMCTSNQVKFFLKCSISIDIESLFSSLKFIKFKK